jgi:hypothetical protein
MIDFPLMSHWIVWQSLATALCDIFIYLGHVVAHPPFEGGVGDAIWSQTALFWL